MISVSAEWDIGDSQDLILCCRWVPAPMEPVDIHLSCFPNWSIANNWEHRNLEI